MIVQRLQKLRNVMSEKSLNAFLVSNFYNIVYLTDFKTLTTNEREAFVLVTKKNTYLFTDERYVNSNLPASPAGGPLTTYKLRLIEPGKGLLFHLDEIVKEEKIKKVGFESEDLRYHEYNTIKLRLSTTQLIPTVQLVIAIREIKDDIEIQKIEKACEIGDQCLQELLPLIKEEMTEKEIAFKMEMWIKEKGYDLAFDPIVAIDANSAVAHHNTKEGSGKVRKGSVVLLDYGVKYKGYLSDITRMLFFGQPTDEMSRAYRVLLNAQESAVKKISEIISLKDIDLFCRKLITDPPAGEAGNHLPSYPHSTGHGVGLEIHEYPKVSLNSADLKKEHQIITIEPGVYFPGKWGMRIEDTVVINKDLSARILTKYPKSLQII